jgi:uracil-DNA glycosylase family 4
MNANPLQTNSIEEFIFAMNQYACGNCILLSEARLFDFHTYPIPNLIDTSSKLVIVNSFPDKKGRTITDETKALLDQCLGVPYSYLNSCLCVSRHDKTTPVEHVIACRPFLIRQLELLSPKVILALGRTALSSLFNDYSRKSMQKEIPKLRKIQLSTGAQPIVLCTYNPKHLVAFPSCHKHQTAFRNQCQLAKCFL